MSERNDQSGSFWRTLPGILSAIAALVTAVTGLIIGLSAAGSTGDKAEPASRSMTAASSDGQPRVVADAIAGTWSGEATQREHANFDVHVTIGKGCAVGEPCGSISISSQPCFGDLSLAGVSGDRYEFSVDHFSTTSAKSCKPGAGEYLTPHGDDALLYTTGYDRSIRGILHPPR